MQPLLAEVKELELTCEVLPHYVFGCLRESCFTSKLQNSLCDKKRMFTFGHCPNQGGGEAPARKFWPSFHHVLIPKIFRSEGMVDLVAKWEKIKTIQDFAFILSLDSVTMEVKGKMRDILKEAQLGLPAPNLELVDLATKAKMPLLSLAKAGRPLVVNFGSGS